MSQGSAIAIAGLLGVAAGAIHLNAAVDLWGVALIAVGVATLIAGLFWKRLKSLTDAR